MEEMTVTELRGNIYKVIDRIIATGEPCEIVRGNRRVTIAPEPVKKVHKTPPATRKEGQMTRLEKLPKRKIWLGKSDDLAYYKVWDEDAWNRKWDERLKE